MDRAPIRGHKTLEAEFIAQDFGQRGLVVAGKESVDTVVGAHDGRDTGLDGRIERRDIDLVQCLVIYLHVSAVRVIGHKMLYLGHNVLRLDTLDLGCANETGKKRIFAESVVAAGKVDVAVNVHEGLQGDVDAQRAAFTTDHYAVIFSILYAESGGNAHGSRLRLRRVARKHARRPIGKAHPRNAQPRNSAQVACLTLVHRRSLLRAVDQRELFFKRHLAQQLIDPSIASDHRHALRQRHACA